MIKKTKLIDSILPLREYLLPSLAIESIQSQIVLHLVFVDVFNPPPTTLYLLTQHLRYVKQLTCETIKHLRHVKQLDMSKV